MFVLTQNVICIELQEPIQNLTAASSSYIDSNYVGSIFENLHFASKIENGEILKEECVDLDLKAQLEELARVNNMGNTTSTSSSSIRFTVNTANLSPFVHADPSLFTRILQPLLNYAARNAPPGSTAEMCVFSLGPKFTFKVSFSTLKEIDADAVFRSFHLYYANNSEMKGYAGTGLSLFVASHFIQAMGGSLEFYSSPEEAIFQFDIPLKQISEASIAPINRIVQLTPRGTVRWTDQTGSSAASAHLRQSIPSPSSDQIEKKPEASLAEVVSAAPLSSCSNESDVRSTLLYFPCNHNVMISC